jgi:hypothetical protein
VNGNTGVITQSYSEAMVSQVGPPGTFGGLVAENQGTIIQSYSAGNVGGRGELGGLVGTNGGLIKQSYETGSVQGALQNFENDVGGIAGINIGTITECYAVGFIGDAGGTRSGIVGRSFSGSSGVVDSCYWDTQATGTISTNGGTGLTTAQLQSGTLPSGFDPSVWSASQGQYPRLRWESTPPFSLPTAAPPIGTFPMTLADVPTFVQTHLSQFSPETRTFIQTATNQDAPLLTELAKGAANLYAPLPAKVAFWLEVFSEVNDCVNYRELGHAISCAGALIGDAQKQFGTEDALTLSIDNVNSYGSLVDALLTEVADPVKAAKVPLNAASAAGGVIATFLPSLGDSLRQFGSDPPDNDFQSLYTPISITSSSFARLPAPLGDTLNRAVVTVSQATIYLNAANRSFDRYQAALLASDNIHASFQLEAVLYYLGLYRKAAEDASPALNDFESALTSVLGRNWSPSLSQLTALQSQWAAIGIPSEVRLPLASLGLSDAEINALATDFESANLSPPQGQSIYTELSDLISALPLLVSHASTISTLLSEVRIALQEGDIDNQGVATSLTSKLQAAQAAQRQQTAMQQITAFINEVSAQSGNHIDKATADLLIADAEKIFAQ